jgi:hypothetical protein
MLTHEIINRSGPRKNSTIHRNELGQDSMHKELENWLRNYNNSITKGHIFISFIKTIELYAHCCFGLVLLTFHIAEY